MASDQPWVAQPYGVDTGDIGNAVKAIELCPGDRARWVQQTSASIFVLAEMPTLLAQIGENEKDTGLGPGVIPGLSHL